MAIDGVGEFRTCLLPMVTPWARNMLAMHTDYSKSLLPFGEGTLEQPAAFMEAMRIIEGRLNDNRKRHNKSQR